MSLTARERQTLHVIEDRLTGSDPGLASLLATFTRLTCSEEMPPRERIQRGRRRALRRPRTRGHGPRRDVFRHARRLCQRLGWQWAVLLMCLTAAAVEVVVVALVVGLNGPQARPAASRPGNIVPGRWYPVARRCGDINAAAGTRRVQLTTGTR